MLLSFLLKETEGRRRSCNREVLPQHSWLAVIPSQPFPLGTEHEIQRAALSYGTVTRPPSISPFGVSLVTLAAVVLRFQVLLFNQHSLRLFRVQVADVCQENHDRGFSPLSSQVHFHSHSLTSLSLPLATNPTQNTPRSAESIAVEDSFP